MTTSDASHGDSAPTGNQPRMAPEVRSGIFSKSAHLLLAAFCTLIGAFSIWSNSVGRLPFYATQRFDPEICYLLNSVAPFVSAPYTYADHPGTPVEIAGTVALAPFRLVSRDSESFCLAVLKDPDRYLSVFHWLTALSVAAGAMLLARHMVLRWRIPPLAAATAAIAPFAFHPLAFPSLSLWSHNSLAYPLLPFALLFCADNLRQDDGPTGWRTFISGILFGVLTAVQFYHVVWIAAALFGTACLLWSKIQFRAVVSAFCTLATGAVLGFVILTLPIAEHYAAFFGFIWRIASRTGHYGNGGSGIPTNSEWLANLTGLRSALDVFPWALCLAVTATSLLLLYRSKVRASALWVLAGMAALTLAIVKHPQPIYTLALNAGLPVLLLFCIYSSSPWVYRYLVRPVIVIVMVAVGVNFTFSLKRESTQLAAFQDSIGKVHGTLDTIVRQRDRAAADSLILYTYLVPQRANALRFGDSYSGGVFSEMIDHVYPNDGFLNLGETEIRIPAAWPKQCESTSAYVAVCARFRSMLPSIKHLTPCAQIAWGETQMGSGDILLFEIPAPLFNLPIPAGSLAALINIDQSIAPLVAVDPRSSAPWWGLDGESGWVGESIDESYSITLWARQNVDASLSLDAKAGPGENGIELVPTLNAERIAARPLTGEVPAPASFLLPLKKGRNELRLSSSRSGRILETLGKRQRPLSIQLQNLWLEQAEHSASNTATATPGAR